MGTCSMVVGPLRRLEWCTTLIPITMTNRTALQQSTAITFTGTVIRTIYATTLHRHRQMETHRSTCLMFSIEMFQT